MLITRPAPSEYFSYYDTYVSKVPGNDLLSALLENRDTFSSFIKSIPADKLDYRYTENKWTVKEVIVHLTDAERIFAYRALRFARNDKTGLSGFDENDYVPQSNAASQTAESLLEEFHSVRHASITLFKSFTPEMSLRNGHANGKEISVRALGYIIVGHTTHHMQTIHERYLN